jgi:hypothetical protein
VVTGAKVWTGVRLRRALRSREREQDLAGVHQIGAYSLSASHPRPVLVLPGPAGGGGFGDSMMPHSISNASMQA